MSKPAIEQPRIFISYAWGTESYQEKVLSFALDLVNDGIDVVLDKWSLKEGNDTYAFMEQSVVDESITNVLILLDPCYEEKANRRSGGVGTETQIISPEIYNKVKQEKFLPVIFERGINGEMPKPVYLKGLLHFDLSKNDTYDEEYRRLVKRLYGIEILKKPELGHKPAWLEITTPITVKKRNAYSELNGNFPVKVKTVLFESFLEECKNKIIGFRNNESLSGIPDDKYIAVYEETQIIRNEFLELMQYILFVEHGEKLVASKFEEISNELSQNGTLVNEIQKTLLHELFIYTIAIYYKSKNFDALLYTLGRSYFVDDFKKDKMRSFNVFYKYNHNLDNAVSKRDGKNYYSGTATWWVENVNVNICSKNEFVFSDILCYNATIFLKNNRDPRYWFPLTYVYGGNENRMIRNFALKLQSIEHLMKTAYIFGHDNIDSFKDRFIEIEMNLMDGSFKDYRHSSAFEEAPLLCHYIKSEELGTRN